MTPSLRRPLPRAALVAGAALLAAAPAGAQALWAPAVRVGPQFVSYDIKEPVNKTISQFALPIAVAFQVSERFTVDLAGAYATSRVEAGTRSSEITGLTDTQLRA